MKVAIILGTRPEIIKMSPVIRACERQGLDYFIYDRQMPGEINRFFFRDEKDALVGIIREQAKNKIYYYEKKISEMERKYKVDFREFKKIIEGRKDEEVFEEWDDFIQWESYEEALRYWTEVEERVKGKAI